MSEEQLVSEEKTTREIFLLMVDEERNRQQELGKEDNNSWAMWLIIMTDYLGKVSNTLWRLVFSVEETDQHDLLRALVKLLAIGVAWGEHIIISDPDKETITVRE